MADSDRMAPGAPGVAANWATGAKCGVGTAANLRARLWFTLGEGVLNEVYFPRIDRACIRDLGFIVTGPGGFAREERKQTEQDVAYLVDGVPAYRLTNTCRDGRFRITKDIIADPWRECVLQNVRFEALRGTLADYRLFALLAPRLSNQGTNNNAWLADHRGVPMLLASHHDAALALAGSAPWRARSVGFAGVSGGYDELLHHGHLVHCSDRAEAGNVALVGEIDLAACDGRFRLVLGFGINGSEAGLRTRASLLDDWDEARDLYIRQWLDRLKLWCPDGPDGRGALELLSATVLSVHESKAFPGATIASLAIPWGPARTDDPQGPSVGGYHLVWPRDLIMVAGGQLAVGRHDNSVRALYYLRATQNADGHWLQNMWLNGDPYWDSVQLGETALPILLFDLLRREGALKRESSRFWPSLRAAAGYLVRSGPTSREDRWELTAGITPFTLAAEIAALLVAADLADEAGEPDLAAYLRETADAWNARIDDWLYATGTELARRIGVDGYYIRIAPAQDGPRAGQGSPRPTTRPDAGNLVPAHAVVSPDALALVRFGLRAADDPRIANTVRVIDALLKVETPYGPCWRRFNGDNYGEHDDGSAYDGQGVGRAWPLLTGERGHYELAAGRRDAAEAMLCAMERFAGPGGMIPEQIWDATDLPDRGLFLGRPSGSAMPLAWAHAEYAKLSRSLRDGRVFDLPPQTVRRYLETQTDSRLVPWKPDLRLERLPAGHDLRLEVHHPATVRWGLDALPLDQTLATRATGLGVHVADLPTADLQPGRTLRFRFDGLSSPPGDETFSVVVVEPSS